MHDTQWGWYSARVGFGCNLSNNQRLALNSFFSQMISDA